MKLVILFGPCAVGKMTVGQELARRTGMKLFHNHMTIELAREFFDYATPEGRQLVQKLRQDIFETVADSDLEGLIFTYVWAFEMQSDWDYIRALHEMFAKKGEVYYVELSAGQQVRLSRNRTPNRLKNKPSKRNLAWSDDNLISNDAQHRLNSEEGELQVEHYLRLDNTDLPADEAALRIMDAFHWWK